MADSNGIIYKELSFKVVGLAMQVHSELGPGFLEKVYERSLMVLFEENGLKAEFQVPIPVLFHGRLVGDYCDDIIVEDSILIELKAQDRIAEIHKAQVLNYLKATGYRLGLLLNFGKYRLESQRIVL